MARKQSNAHGRKGTEKVKLSLSLDALAYKRLGAYAHVQRRTMSSVVEEGVSIVLRGFRCSHTGVDDGTVPGPEKQGNATGETP
jgi:hypothetical protein